MFWAAEKMILMSLCGMQLAEAQGDTQLSTAQYLTQHWGSSSSPSRENKTSQLPTPAVARPTSTAAQHQRLRSG